MVNDEPNSRDVSVSVEKPSAPPRSELQAARSGSVVAPLSQVAVIEFSGPDAESFLQGQLTCDVESLRATASYGAWCSPQGRMLASLLLWRGDAGFLMALRADIAAGVQQRIARYVLRAKVAIARAPLALIGVSGADAVPGAELEARASGAETRIRLDAARHLLVVPEAAAEARIAELAARSTRVSAAAWDWLDVRAGIPWISAATQDRLVPQMVNLERIGGVSFTKGCYTGQELVARIDSRGGNVPRHLRRLAISGAAPPPGSTLHDGTGKEVGVVTSVATTGDGAVALAYVGRAVDVPADLELRAPDGGVAARATVTSLG